MRVLVAVCRDAQIGSCLSGRAPLAAVGAGVSVVPADDRRVDRAAGQDNDVARGDVPELGLVADWMAIPDSQDALIADDFAAVDGAI